MLQTRDLRQTDGRTLVTFGRPQNLKVLKRFRDFQQLLVLSEDFMCIHFSNVANTKRKIEKKYHNKKRIFILHFLLSYKEFRVDIIKTFLACNTLKI